MATDMATKYEPPLPLLAKLSLLIAEVQELKTQVMADLHQHLFEVNHADLTDCHVCQLTEGFLREADEQVERANALIFKETL